ncbi:MAG: HemK2/MTQ2 family protein methyltransferase [Candidatus Diapherotrites archaeon]|nr:methyltransferase [Candidatus Micrarchaeota archaeon]MBU1939724.1 methyltransferase [Candidatus Micrarchaeota archaeon]
MPEKAFFAGKPLVIRDSVYAPAEDSFLLADSIPVRNYSSALDMGTGSGIQAINLAIKGAREITAVDINPEALKATAENAAHFGFSGRITAVRSDLFSALRGAKFDIIVFNPPYVPSPAREFDDVDGGPHGRDVLDRFLRIFGSHLNPNGECYFIQSSLNSLALTHKKLRALGRGMKIIARKKLFFEELLVIKADG